MTRAQLEHIIRAAATIADDDEIVVLGSQAVLGQFQGAARQETTGRERREARTSLWLPVR